MHEGASPIGLSITEAAATIKGITMLSREERFLNHKICENGGERAAEEDDATRIGSFKKERGRDVLKIILRTEMRRAMQQEL